MDFLQGNWFSLLAVAAYAVVEIVKRGRKDQKADNVSDKVDELAKSMKLSMDNLTASFTAHERKFNEHVANNDIHVTDMLLELLRERNDYAKNEFANTRMDIQRVETMMREFVK